MKKKIIDFFHIRKRDTSSWRAEGILYKKGITWELTPCAVRPSAPIMPPSRGIEMPGRVGEEVCGKGQADVGDSCSLERVLPRGTGFRGGRGSVWRPRPGMTPPGAIRGLTVNHNPASITRFIFNLSNISVQNQDNKKINDWLIMTKVVGRLINRLTAMQMFIIRGFFFLGGGGCVCVCSLWLKAPRLERTDAKPWGRSPSRWTPCWTGRAARGFSPMSPGCWPRERAEFRVTRGHAPWLHHRQRRNTQT